MHIIILTRYSRIYWKIWKWKKILCETVRKVKWIYNEKASYRYVCFAWSIFDHGLCPHTLLFLSESLILFLWRFSDASHFTLTFAIPCIFAYVFQWSHTGVWLQVLFLFFDNWANYFSEIFFFWLQKYILSLQPLGFDGASLFFRETQLSELEIDRDLSTYVYYSSLDVLPR